jgi:hypothetical protein
MRKAAVSETTRKSAHIAKESVLQLGFLQIARVNASARSASGSAMP